MAVLKTKDELLKDLSKANQARKEVLANRAGFSTVEDYKKHLESSNILLTEDEKKPKIHIVNILDISSSMSGGKFMNAYNGIVSEINEFKTDDKTDYTTTFVSFSDSDKVKRHYFNVPLSDVKHPNINPNGLTALNQAVGETLEGLLNLKDKDVKTVVSIFTDGEENASVGKYSSKESIAEMVKKAEAADITVTFIGTQSDVANVIKGFGVQSTNTLVHNNTADGEKASFLTKSSATRSYSSRVSRGDTKEELLTGFYSKSTGKL